jgi:phytoene dehydrogenase-like protein
MRSARANLRAGLPIFISERLGPAELGTLPPFLAGALFGGEVLFNDGKRIRLPGTPNGAAEANGEGRCEGATDGVSLLADWPLRTHGGQCASRFRSARHRALLSYQDLYIGLPPSEAPAVFSLLQAIELAEPDAPDDLDACGGDDSGVWYPMGGFGAFRDLLVEACERAGVRLAFGCRAREVSVARGAGGRARVTGVHVERMREGEAAGEEWGACGEPPGAVQAAQKVQESEHPPPDEAGDAGGRNEWLSADCVIVNADLAAAEPQLLGRVGMSRSSYRDASEVRRDARGADGGTGRARSAAVNPCGGHSQTETAPGSEQAAEPRERRAAAPPRELSQRAWRFSSSSVTFLWCMDRRFDALRHHNVFLAPEADNPWDGLFDAAAFSEWGARGPAGAGSDPAPFHFYLCAPSRTDASVVQRPSDDAIMVLVPVPPIDETLTPHALAEAEAEVVARGRAGVLSTLETCQGCRGFAQHIVGERVRTPRGWRAAYGLRRGSVFGLSHGLDQLSLLRPGRQHGSVGGLHFVGASTRPGNGVPLVLIGADKAAEEALAELGMREGPQARRTRYRS